MLCLAFSISQEVQVVPEKLWLQGAAVQFRLLGRLKLNSIDASMLGDKSVHCVPADLLV